MRTQGLLHSSRPSPPTSPKLFEAVPSGQGFRRKLASQSPRVPDAEAEEPPPGLHYTHLRQHYSIPTVKGCFLHDNHFENRQFPQSQPYWRPAAPFQSQLKFGTSGHATPPCTNLCLQKILGISILYLSRSAEREHQAMSRRDARSRCYER